MKKFLAFLNNMDARAWRTVWVSLVLLGGVVAITVLGRSLPGASGEVEHWLAGLRESPWALPATIVIFILTAFIAMPQLFLAGACVLAFGPWLGFTYALIATVVSSALQFWIGRAGGTKLVRRYGGDAVNRLSRFIGRNDFWASAIVRNVPVSTAIVVNMVFGASHANFWRFIAGVAIGSIPKILIAALLGQSVVEAMGGGVVLAVGLAFIVVGTWITIALAARKAVHKDDELSDGDDKKEGG